MHFATSKLRTRLKPLLLEHVSSRFCFALLHVLVCSASHVFLCPRESDTSRVLMTQRATAVAMALSNGWPLGIWQ